MKTELAGYGVGRGLAIGPVLHMAPPLPEPPDVPRTTAVEEEKARTHRASAVVAEELFQRGAQAGGVAEDILQAASLMAQDPALLNDIDAKIDAGKTGTRAVFEAMAAYRDLLSGMGGYLAERAGDLDDVSQRIRANLLGIPAPGVPESSEPYILVATDLSPADTATLDFTIVQALITEEGGPTSHTAILARANSLPALVGVAGATDIPAETIVLVDAGAGLATISPSQDQQTLAYQFIEDRATFLTSATGPGRLADDTPVQLLANLGSVSEAHQAKEVGCEGVGLFRTEFLFLDSTTAPTMEQQTATYRELLDVFPGKKVVVRLLDAGADKPLPYLTADNEENPALGLRGYRALREHTEVLDSQLEALGAAARDSDADLWVMAPMITDALEAQEFTERAKSHGLKTVGVMAEVPSVAVLADQIVASTDFLSIGTNDLTQYTMAADRLLGTVASYQDPWHPAVLRLVRFLGEACQAADKPLGVCGEAAADPDLAAVLVGLGATSLSMAPAALPEVRANLATINSHQARQAAQAACSARDATEARRLALSELGKSV